MFCTQQKIITKVSQIERSTDDGKWFEGTVDLLRDVVWGESLFHRIVCVLSDCLFVCFIKFFACFIGLFVCLFPSIVFCLFVLSSCLFVCLSVFERYKKQYQDAQKAVQAKESIISKLNVDKEKMKRDMTALKQRNQELTELLESYVSHQTPKDLKHRMGM